MSSILDNPKFNIRLPHKLTSDQYALSLYQAGKHGTEIAEILGDEYHELDGYQIDKIVNDAKETFEENKNRHEL